MSRDEDLRAFALRPRAEVQALKAATHAASTERRHQATLSMAEHLRSLTSRAEDLLHHVEVQARLARIDRERLRQSGCLAETNERRLRSARAAGRARKPRKKP